MVIVPICLPLCHRIVVFVEENALIGSSQMGLINFLIQQHLWSLFSSISSVYKRSKMKFLNIFIVWSYNSNFSTKFGH